MAAPIDIEAHRESFRRIAALIAPFNSKGIPITPQTTFAGDLDLDSLAVMDLVAAIEDEFDIVIPLNILPELETVGEVAAAVDRIREESR